MESEPEVGGDIAASTGNGSSAPVSPSIQTALAMAAAAASRRRKQSKPRQLASTNVGNDDADTATAEVTIASDTVESRFEGDESASDSVAMVMNDAKSTFSARCPNCPLIFTDVRQFLGHAQYCGTVGMATDYDNDDDDYDDVDDVDDDVYRSSNESSEPDLYCRKPSTDIDKYTSGDKNWHSETGSDDEYSGNFRSDQSPPEAVSDSAAAAEASHVTENDVRAIDLFTKSIDSRSYPFDLTAVEREGQGLPSLSAQSTVEAAMMTILQNKMAAADLSRIMTFDKNVSPTSKITMLESAIYGLHRQQLMQLELIETLRRQLAAAVAAKADSSSAPPPNHTAVPFSYHDLIIPRSGQPQQSAIASEMTTPEVDGAPAASETATVFVGNGSSSLSNLMRLSASVDRQVSHHHHHQQQQHQQQPQLPGRLTSSPVHQQSGVESESKWSSQTMNRSETDLTASRRIDDMDSIKSRDLNTANGSKSSGPPPSGGGLAELNLFKKAKAPNVTVGRMVEQPSFSETPMTSSGPTGSDDSTNGSAVFKHRCQMCLKVLGSDSALQIHMRSHTGERPYKCNICGNRFTTKGNLKVHFQRHLEQYPNARMNPDPVPEYLDHQRPVHHPVVMPTSSMSNVYDRQFQTLIGNQSTLSMTPQPSQSYTHHKQPQQQQQQPMVPMYDTPPVSLTGAQPKQPFHQDSTPKQTADMPLTATPISVKQETAAAFSSTYDKIDIKSQMPSAITSSGTVLDAPPTQHHPQPSPLSALSSMSSALATSFPPHHMLRGGVGGVGGVFPTTIPLPATVPPNMGQMPATPALSSPAIAAAFSSQFRSQSTAVGTPPGTGCLPMTSLKPDLDDDDALEQYMEIQQTDTSKIEELVREATAAAAASSGEGKNSEGGATSDPNECILCHRVLSCRSALQMHYRTHTGERPYRCRLCGRTFTTKGNLKTHMTVHRARSSGFGGQSLMGGAGGHRCPVCRRDFTGSLALQQHIRAAHSTPTSGTVTSSAVNPSSAGSSGLQTIAGGNMQTAGSMAMPFPGQMPNHPGGPNAAAMAAAMMMMPGLNSLLPFINFPFYPTGPLGGPSFHPHGAQMFVRPSTAGQPPPNNHQFQQQQLTDEKRHFTAELDLRKKTGSDDNGREKRPTTAMDSDEGEEEDEYERRSGGTKRSKMDDESSHTTAANLSLKDGLSRGNRSTPERGCYGEENRTKFSGDASRTTQDFNDDDAMNSDDNDDEDDEEVGDGDPDNEDDDIHARRLRLNHERGQQSEVYGFDYRLSRSRNDESGNREDKISELDVDEVGTRGIVSRADDSRSTSVERFTSPLMALEQRLNAITKHGSHEKLDEKNRDASADGYGEGKPRRRDDDSKDWESDANNQDSENGDVDDVDGNFSSGIDNERRQYTNKDNDDDTGNGMSYQDHLDGRALTSDNRMFDGFGGTDGKSASEYSGVDDQPNKSDRDMYDNRLRRQQLNLHDGSEQYGSSDSRESCSPSSPGDVTGGGGAPINHGSRGSSIASNSSSGLGATPPDSALRYRQQPFGSTTTTPSRSSTLADLNHQHHQSRQQQIASGMSTSSLSAPSAARFVCSVCSKPFASASALEIHSRTHSGDRPFVCQVCSKAFTTKGNLKVHMGTHAWNRCPSRRGRRMSVVDPATAAVAAAAVVASSVTSVPTMNAAGINVTTTMPPTAVDFFAAAAAAAAAAANPFTRFVADSPGVTRSMSVFGYAPPLTSGSSTNTGGFFPDVRQQLARFGLGGTGFGSTPGLSPGEKPMQWMLGTSRDERNNNNSTSNNNGGGGSRKTSLASSTGGVPSSFTAASFSSCGLSPRGSSIGCGELDLSVGRNNQLVVPGRSASTSVGRTSTPSASSVTAPAKEFTTLEMTTPSRTHRSNVTGLSGNSGIITGGVWNAAAAGSAGDHRGPTSLTAVMSNCG